MPRTVLVVDDDASVLKVLKHGLTKSGYLVEAVDGGMAALALLRSKTFDAVLVDLGMPEVDGFAILEEAVSKGRCRAVIVITGEGSIPIAVAAMRAGASDFITKPIDFSRLNASLKRALGEPVDERLQADRRRAWRDQYAPGFIGDDQKMLEIFGIIERIATTDCNVLVTGISGSGKELVAKAIHAASGRHEGPLVAVNCAAIPKELMESEIFGHGKGAFTGASEAREGKFQQADGGTLFLDEIGEMDLSLQSKFLRVIQEREFTPVGESKPRKANVRIVSATNRDLLVMAGEGKFREDLFYRLNVIPIHLPSLKERRSDIPRLANFFIERSATKHGRRVSGATEEVMRGLRTYDWPGNVRELENLIERMVILKDGDGLLEPRDLPGMFKEGSPLADDMELLSLPEEGVNMRELVDEMESKLIIAALNRCDGNKAKASELLGLKRTTLIERLKRLGIDNY
ncbi:MAG: sigma-54 dependent transcriptional regulator [Myxococcota bacterium]|nr:sigma-54 dependent transcriptional regulator [Myxococcota bacterium]